MFLNSVITFYYAGATELMKHELLYQYLNSSLLYGSQSLIFRPFLPNMYSQLSTHATLPGYHRRLANPIHHLPRLALITLTHIKSYMKILIPFLLFNTQTVYHSPTLPPTLTPNHNKIPLLNSSRINEY
jgi:hypothetical protein